MSELPSREAIMLEILDWLRAKKEPGTQISAEMVMLASEVLGANALAQYVGSGGSPLGSPHRSYYLEVGREMAARYLRGGPSFGQTV